ncbi:MAG TPA: LuxR C-terminal-related transcriptional regulator [Candidatus Acidoferrum sp.]|nr:LuxR C-terminal-related transcriptional regulator [Candidatus Acidoferrum sp.]
MLPTPRTPFIGRARQKEELLGLLSGCRLLTLVGPGGCGKTRLGIEVVRDWVAKLEMKAAFVDLSAIGDSKAVTSDFARQLGVQTKARESVRAALIGALNQDPLVLVVDNCEPVLEACREILGLLLDACRELKVVATSREPLRLPAELVWRLSPLAIPPVKARPDELAAYESLELFLDRARLTSGGLVSATTDLSAVADLCRRLDGLPLAIELAAAWVPVLGVAGISNRLSRRLDLLTDSPYAPAPRHLSLRVVLDDSDALLSAEERTLWRRLAIFAPGFDLEAIEAVNAVGSDGKGAPAATAQLLRKLVERSLIQAQIDEAYGARYRLFETVRAYGLEKLADAGELERVAAAHATHYADRAEAAWAHRDSADLVEWAARMTADHPNVRVALDWLRGHDHERELQLAGAMAWVWGARELLPEGRRLLELAVKGPATSSWFAARAHRAAGMLALEGGDTAIARRRFRHALQLFEALDDEAGQAFCLARLGILERNEAANERRAMLEHAVELAERSGEQPSLVVATANLGALELEHGAPRASRQRFEDAVALCREMEHARWLPQILEGLAQARLAQGDAAAARDSLVEAITLAERAGLQALLPSLLETAAAVAVATQGPDLALRLAGAAARLRKANVAALPHEWPSKLSSALKEARRLRAGAADALWEEGAEMDAREAIAFAVSGGGPPELLSSHKRISRRQAEVAALVVLGLTNAEIAARLSISERTAEWHLEELRNRLGFSSRSQIAAWAVNEGLAAPDRGSGRRPG